MKFGSCIEFGPAIWHFFEINFELFGLSQHRMKNFLYKYNGIYMRHMFILLSYLSPATMIISVEKVEFSNFR
jgi:hypothetical protein